MEDLIKNIKKSFKNEVSIKEKRPGIFQLYLPIYHEDGDMIDLYVTAGKNGQYMLCDYAHTVQRLSYSFDIDTPNKESILNRILVENNLVEINGNICFDTKPETVFTDIMHVTQAYAKIGSMKYFKREVIESLFFEILDDYVFTQLKEFKPEKNVFPIPDRDDLEADYSFRPNGHPVYLFGIKDTTKARLATISCLEYQIHKVNFRSIAVYDNFDGIPKKDRSRLTNAVDKQFTSFDDFKSGAVTFLERERTN